VAQHPIRHAIFILAARGADISPMHKHANIKLSLYFMYDAMETSGIKV
jgi:hypothetical protein